MEILKVIFRSEDIRGLARFIVDKLHLSYNVYNEMETVVVVESGGYFDVILKEGGNHHWINDEDHIFEYTVDSNWFLEFYSNHQEMEEDDLYKYAIDKMELELMELNANMEAADHSNIWSKFKAKVQLCK